MACEHDWDGKLLAANKYNKGRIRSCSQCGMSESFYIHMKNERFDAEMSLFAEIDRHAAREAELVAALDATLTKYITLADSGDCGFWEPRDEPHVIAARAALGKE